jgi:four helix bundle protein
MAKNSMTKLSAPNVEKRFDLEDRTFEFAKRVRALIKTLPRTIANIEDAKQLVRCSGSVGANYIEANDSLGKKDFCLRIKISRKESKESRFFLRLIDTGKGAAVESERAALVIEPSELVSIFSAILRKME